MPDNKLFEALNKIGRLEYDLRGVPQLRDREYGSVPALPAPAAQASSVEDAGVGANARARNSDPAEQVDVRWSFRTDCWEASFREPSTLQGKKLMCRVEDLNDKKVALVGVQDLERLPYDQQLNVAKEYLRFRAVQAVQAAMKPPAATPASTS